MKKKPVYEIVVWSLAWMVENLIEKKIKNPVSETMVWLLAYRVENMIEKKMTRSVKPSYRWCCAKRAILHFDEEPNCLYSFKFIRWKRPNCINCFSKSYWKNLCSLSLHIGLLYRKNLNGYKHFGSSSKCQISPFRTTSSIWSLAG